MPRNRNKYRRESLTEVRVNGQNIRVSPYLAQYTAEGWYLSIDKVLDPVSQAKQIEANIGWFGPARQ